MITLKQTTPDDCYEYTAVREVTMTLTSEASLTEMLDAFGQFLRATGYSFDGQVTIEEGEI